MFSEIFFKCSIAFEYNILESALRIFFPQINFVSCYSFIPTIAESKVFFKKIFDYFCKRIMIIFIGKSACIILRIVHFRNFIYFYFIFCIKNGHFLIETPSQKSS